MVSHAFFFISEVKDGENLPRMIWLNDRHASAKTHISPSDQFGFRDFLSVIIDLADDNGVSENMQYACVAFVVRIVFVPPSKEFQT